MTTRSRVLLAVGALVLPVALAPLLLLSPVLAIGLPIAVGIVALASRSVVYPVALAGLPAAAIGIAGGNNPLPQGAVTMFAFAWTGLAIGIAVLRSDDELPLRVLLTPAVVSSVVLMVWLLVRLGASLDPAYGSRKLQLFVVGNLILLVAGTLIGRRADRVELWVLVALLMALLSAFALTRQLLAGTAKEVVGGRFAITGADSPIGLGRDAARGLLLGTYVLLVSRVTWMRLLALAALPFIAVPFMASGSRGPVLGLIAGLLILFSLTLRDAQSRRRILLVFVGALIAVAIVPQLVPGHDIGRTLSVFSGTNDTNGRSHLWSLSWTLFAQHPLFGIGTGSFHAFGGVEYYPHNFLLEAAAELGIVGLAAVVLVAASAVAQAARVMRVARGIDRTQAALVVSLLGAAIVNACLSGDLTTNQSMWFAAGLVVGVGRRMAVVQVFDPLVMMRARRGEHGRARRAVPTDPRRGLPAPTREPGRWSPGRILSPTDGATVAGLVRVEVEPARTPRPVRGVRLEWERAGEWVVAAEVDERTFEVSVADGSAAIVRSEWLADLIATALGGRATLSRRRPWGSRRTFVFGWDSAELAPARGRLRAVTVDLDGTETATDAIELELQPAAPAEGSAAIDASEVVRRVRERTALASVGRVDALQRREDELDQRTRAADERERTLTALRDRVAADRRALETRAQEVERLRTSLAGREHGLAERERAVAADLEVAQARVADAAAAEAALESREAAVRMRESELQAFESRVGETRTALESRERALDEREQRLRRELEDVLAREAPLTELQERLVDESARELAAARTKLDERTREVAAREERVAGLEAREAELAAQRELAERLRQDVLERARRVAADRSALEARERHVAATEAQLHARQLELDTISEQVEALAARHDERERAVTAREQAVEVGLEGLRAREDALEAERTRVQAREQRLVADAESFALRERELAELEAGLRMREAEVASQSVAFEARGADVASREQALAERETHLTERARELSQREAQLAERDRLLREREIPLTEIQERLVDEAAAELAAARAELQEREQRVVAAEMRAAALVRREVELERREQEFATTVEQTERERREELERRTREAAEREARLAQLEADQAEREERIRTMTRDAASRMAEVAARREQADARAADVETLEASVAERERVLGEQAAALEARAAALARDEEERTAALAARTAELETREREEEEALAARRAELERLEREHEEAVAVQRAELDDLRREHEAELAARSAELAEREREHAETVARTEAERLAILEERARAADEREARVAADEERIAQLERELGARDAELEERERTVTAESRSAAEREAFVASRGDELDARAAEVQELARATAERERAAEERERTAAEREEQLAARARELADRDEALAAATARAEALEAGLARRERELEAREAQFLERAERFIEETTPRIDLVPLEDELVRGRVEFDVVVQNVRRTAVALEVVAAGATAWDAPRAPGLSLDTRDLADGWHYVRAVGDGGASEPMQLLVDNGAPTVRIVAPLANTVVAGAVPITVEADDAASGVHSVILQRSLDGRQWRPIAGDTWDTTRDEDGQWYLRATAVDRAKNVGTSDAVRVTVANAVRAAPVAPVRAVATAPGRPTLEHLQYVIDAHAELDPGRADELRALLYYLRDFAAIDGTIPAEFDALIDAEFGPLL